MGLSWWVKGVGSKYGAPKSEEDKIKDPKVILTRKVLLLLDFVQACPNSEQQLQTTTVILLQEKRWEITL